MEILIARTSAEIQLAFERLSNADAVGCDTETSGFNSRSGKLFSIQFSDGTFNVLLPISEGIAIARFADLLENADIVKIFHNAKFDLEFLHDAGHTVNNIFDTMIAEKVLTKGAKQSASLAETLYRYFAVDLDKSQRSKFNRNWDGIWTDDLVDYALSDVIHLPDLMREQRSWMERLGLGMEYDEQMERLVSHHR